MSTVALAIGLVVGNILTPGSGLNLTADVASEGAAQAEGAHGSTTEFLLGIIPTSLFSSLTSGEVLQTLLVALLVGFALQGHGQDRQADPAQRRLPAAAGVRILAMIMWAAPVEGVRRDGGRRRRDGLDALKSLAVLMFGFYVTCALFVFVVLGSILKMATGVKSSACSGTSPASSC
jgi:aerobic C4-dicarboxylate transport protein